MPVDDRLAEGLRPPGPTRARVATVLTSPLGAKADIRDEGRTELAYLRPVHMIRPDIERHTDSARNYVRRAGHSGDAGLLGKRSSAAASFAYPVVGCHNARTLLLAGFSRDRQAALWYSLISPLTAVRRLIRAVMSMASLGLCIGG